MRHKLSSGPDCQGLRGYPVLVLVGLSRLVFVRTERRVMHSQTSELLVEAVLVIVVLE